MSYTLLHTLAELEAILPPTITVKEAAEIMEVSPQFLRFALLDGKFPFGTGIKMNQQNEFYINTLRFIKYMKAEI